MFSICPSQIVFRYERGVGPRGLVALDGISFSRECVFDPDNNKLPDISPTSAPPTSSNTPSTSTAPTHPCQVNSLTLAACGSKSNSVKHQEIHKTSLYPLKIIHTYCPPPLVLQDNEFFCWRSSGNVCILGNLQCDYHPDCPQGEDEDGCGELHVEACPALQMLLPFCRQCAMSYNNNEMFAQVDSLAGH